MDVAKQGKRFQIYHALPRDESGMEEESRWNGFLQYVLPWLAGKSALRGRSLPERMGLMAASTAKSAARAVEIATDTRQHPCKVCAELVDGDIGQSASVVAARRSVAKLLAANPELNEQSQKVRAIASEYGIRWTIMGDYPS